MLLHFVDVIKNLYIRHKSTVAFFSKIVTSAGLRAEQFGARPRKPIVTSARCAGSLSGLQVKNSQALATESQAQHGSMHRLSSTQQKNDNTS